MEAGLYCTCTTPVLLPVTLSICAFPELDARGRPFVTVAPPALKAWFRSSREEPQTLFVEVGIPAWIDKSFLNPTPAFAELAGIGLVDEAGAVPLLPLPVGEL